MMKKLFIAVLVLIICCLCASIPSLMGINMDMHTSSEINGIVFVILPFSVSVLCSFLVGSSYNRKSLKEAGTAFILGLVIMIGGLILLKSNEPNELFKAWRLIFSYSGMFLFLGSIVGVGFS